MEGSSVEARQSLQMGKPFEHAGSLHYPLGTSENPSLGLLIIREEAAREVSETTLGTIRDIMTERLYSATRIEVARYDPLTKLFNRSEFQERTQAHLTKALRRGEYLTILLADLDHFKRINDCEGHEAGDAVLREVSRRILGLSSTEVTAGRHGGEELVVSIRHKAANEGVEKAIEIYQAIRSQPVTYDRGENKEPKPIKVTASIGLASAPKDARKVADLLRLADEAMYRAKEDGRDRIYDQIGLIEL